MQRLVNSAKIYRMDSQFHRDQFCDAAVELVRQSGLDSCYLRPIIFRGLDDENPSFGVNPFPNPIDSYIATWQWGKYLGEEALENGIDVCVSSWTRITSNSMPAMAKAGANYMNSQLIKMEAILGGFSEGIALDDRGYVSEGSGENIFLVNNGKLITPPLGASILPGITRDSVIQIARELGHRDRRNKYPARGSLSGGRGVLHRHGRRDHADPFGRPHHGRRRQTRRDDEANSGRILSRSSTRRARHRSVPNG